MSDIRAHAHFSIHDGKLEAFRKAVDECIRIVDQLDTGTLLYDWFINEAGHEAVLIEQFRDSEAVIEHIDHLGNRPDAVLAVSDMSVQGFGEPTPELRERLAKYDVTIFTPLAKAKLGQTGKTKAKATV